MPSQSIIGATLNTPIIAGSDSLIGGFGSQEPNSLIQDSVVIGLGVEWVWKMPGNTGSRLVRTRFSGGTERALDMVRGSDVVATDCTFDAAGQRPITISRFSLAKTCDVGAKGGAQLTLNNCVLSDMLIGDYSIYDNPVIGPKARVILNNCRHPIAGQPIIIRCIWGDYIANGTNVSAYNVSAFSTKVYFALNRKFGDTRVGLPLP